MRPIADYPMPGRDDVPTATAPWTFEASRAMLLVHDMQHYFIEPFADEGLRTSLQKNTAQVLTAFRDQGRPVVYSAQPGRMSADDRGLLVDLWGPGMSTDTDRRIVSGVAPRDGEPVLTKWRYSAFFRSNLAALLRDSGCDQLVICGVFAHLGVLMTASDALAHDVQPFVVADATADLSRSEHVMALEFVARRVGVVVWTDDLIAPDLSGVGPAVATGYRRGADS